VIDYKPKPGSVIEKVINALNTYPVGTRLLTADLVRAARVSSNGFTNTMAIAVERGLIRRSKESTRRVVWFLPYEGDGSDSSTEVEFEEETDADFPPRHVGLYRPGNYSENADRVLQRRFSDKSQANLVSLFRETLTTAKYVKTGDPLKGLVEFNDMARSVHDAKKTSKFSGAEVDLVIAREYKNISMAIMQATANLKETLDMLPLFDTGAQDAK
jgi:hypothetical protein